MDGRETPWLSSSSECSWEQPSFGSAAAWRNGCAVADQKDIEISSGVSLFTGEPFCTIRWGNEAAQMTPDEVRVMALHWLSAAEGAESDALVMQELQQGVGLDLQTAGAFLLKLRERREAAGG